MGLFKKKSYIQITPREERVLKDEETPQIPDGLWIKCSHCLKAVYIKTISELKICPHCGDYFRLSAYERINLVADSGTFVEHDINLTSENPIDFPGYDKKLRETVLKTGITEAVVSGECKIGGYDVCLSVMDSNFIMGSMGTIVGEKITRNVELATEKGIPVIIFTTSGGARMQEGILSLMQMAKVSGALRRHSERGLLYISYITDPTTGGVTASFAMLGDIILSEPKALIGFAGRRVIENTTNEILPDEFQTAEFQLEHGFIDNIIEREQMRETLINILRIHLGEGFYGSI